MALEVVSFLKFMYQVGKISDSQYVLIEQSQGDVSNNEILESTTLTKDSIEEYFSLYKGIVKTNLEVIDPEAVKLLPESICLDLKILPFAVSGSTILVAAVNPTNLDILKEVDEACGYEPVLALVDNETLLERQNEIYTKSSEFKKYGVLAETDVSAASKRTSLGLYNILQESSNIEKMVDTLVMFAIQKESTDIHIEADVKNIQVFFRIKKQLVKIHEFDVQLKERLQLHLIARTNKLITGKDIPHEGSFFVHDSVSGLKINVRLSIIYGVDGYSCVLRLLRELDNDLILLEAELGKLDSEEHRSDIQHVIGSGVGLMIVTGPTSSGKTTLLHDIIRKFIPEDKKLKIISVEDPVELTSPRIIQTESKDVPGRGLEDMIKYCLRQNPDIMIIGETREARTAELLIRAAMSSILVLTTMHSKNAIETVALLSGWNIDNTAIASCLKYIISARLVKVLCKHCKEPEPYISHYKKIIQHLELSEEYDYKRALPDGCEECGHSGYTGLFSLQEHFVLNDQLINLVSKGDVHNFSVAANEHIKNESLRAKVVKLLKMGLISLDEAAKLGLESVQL